MGDLSPVEVEKWLLGLKSLLSGEAVRELANEVRRSQMDGAAFSDLVASRSTPASLRDVVRPSHMATLRRCWNSERPKLLKEAARFDPGRATADETRSNGRPAESQADDASLCSKPLPAEQAPAKQGRSNFAPPPRTSQAAPAAAAPRPATPPRQAAAARPATPPRQVPSNNFADSPEGSPPRFYDDADDAVDAQFAPNKQFAKALERNQGECMDRASRPAQVPRLDLSTLHAKEGDAGNVEKLGPSQWAKPGKHAWTDTGPQYPEPTISRERPESAPQGFACATSEDQQRIAEYYGYRDEGFVATMHGLKTDCIRPRLYLGTMADAAYWPLLQSLSITHILNVAIEAQRAQPPYDGQGIDYMRLPWQDSAEQAHSLNRQRFRTLREATRYIDQSLKATFAVKGKEKKASVLVHCVQGLNRSATIVCAYLMEYEGVSLDRAMSEVRNKHGGCLNSRHWQDMLHKFNAELLRGI